MQMQMLHCIKQTECDGGQNGFADGFWAAQQLRDKHPECFKLLTTLPLDYWDIGEDHHKFYLIDQKPMIRQDYFAYVLQLLTNINQVH